MPTSCNTHDYDGKLRKIWFDMRPTLIEKYLASCLSFDNTIKDIGLWLDKKYLNAKRIGRARRSLRILLSSRNSNFDSCNEIDVEELLPILWDKVKNQEDIHDTFYEQLCDITGGSCSQGRSTRLFQFLFLFDLQLETSTVTSKNKEENIEISSGNESIQKDTLVKKSCITSVTEKENSDDFKFNRQDLALETFKITSSTKKNVTLKLNEQESIATNSLSEALNSKSVTESQSLEIVAQHGSIKRNSAGTMLGENSIVNSLEEQKLLEKAKSDKKEVLADIEQLNKNEQVHSEEITKRKEQEVEEEDLHSQKDQQSNDSAQIDTSLNDS